MSINGKAKGARLKMKPELKSRNPILYPELSDQDRIND